MAQIGNIAIDRFARSFRCHRQDLEIQDICMTDKTMSGEALVPKPEFAVWSRTFLEELANSSNIRASAKKAGVNPADVYRARRSDTKFAREWREALCLGYDILEMSMLYRLRIGELKPASGAKRAVRSYDLATALRLLSAHRESVAAQRALQGGESTDEVLLSLNAKLSRMRQQALEAGREVWALPGDDG
jgi:hypothetical protein